ncbi:MAG: type IX secretion system membrane protein PorP/SprF, partial [Maribacter sp.]|nr:type IX secretion system membrane protein PorP/SprF [Maribacter sp.]
AFKDKTFSGHLQYTHEFENTTGILEGGRLMPLARARKVGTENIVLGGSLILDLPKLGWVQGGYDSFYGAAAGVGFNLSKRLSLGYTMEKGLSNNFDNFGVTHEISFAYSFEPNLTEDRVFLENSDDDLLVSDDFGQEDAVASSAEVEELKRKLAENDAIIEELMFRQDSLENNRKKDLEKRFEMVMRMVRNETNGERPDLEEKAEKLFLGEKANVAVAANNVSNDGREKQQTIAKTRPSQVKTKAPKSKIAKTTLNKVKSRKFRDLQGVEDGYYVVANVYKGGQYMHKFIDGLEQKGIAADYIDNPNNGLKYVYLNRYDSWDEAVAAHKSKLNGNYEGEMWIMNVDNRYTNEAYVDNATKINEKASKYDANVLQQNVIVKDKVAANKQQPKNQIINGVDSGYYLIANVFANPNNANRFVKLLNSYGLNASYFINPENNYRYVYLKRHQSWNNALLSYYTKLNDAYDDKMWIMRVTPSQMA